MNTFGEALRAERIKADLSQQDLAALVGVWQANVSQWERGTQTPVRENLDKLYQLFPTLLEVPEPECREMNKPAGNPNGNPGKRSAETRQRMIDARKTAAPSVPSLFDFEALDSAPKPEECVIDIREALVSYVDTMRAENESLRAENERLRALLGDIKSGIGALANQVREVAA